MSRRVVILMAACAVVLSLGLPAAFAAAPPAPEAAATDAGDAAVAYANALALGNVTRAWSLLSEASKKGVSREKYEAAFNQPRATSKPPASTVLRAIASEAESTAVGGVMVNDDTAYVEVKGNVQITESVFLTKEASGWRVDLKATDEANSREAADLALASVREDASSAAARGQRQEVSMPMLRTLLRPEAKNFKVLKTKAEGDKAEVLVGADIPVSVVLQEVRSGAGWTVRNLAQVDILSPDPLGDAALLAQRQVCEDQLRQIASAIQMYAGESDDQLVDPARWIAQIRPYLRQPTMSLHCPSDPVSTGISYAMNANLAGKRRRDVGNPSTVPMIFESTTHAENAADTGQSWPKSPWHTGGVLVLYADGSVRQAPVKPSFNVPAPTPGATTRPGPARPGRPGGMGGPGAMGGPGGVTVRPRPAPQGQPAPQAQPAPQGK